MDKQQFDALVALEEAKRTGAAVPKAPAEVAAWLQDRGYVDGKNTITSAGVEALEPNVRCFSLRDSAPVWCRSP